MPLLAGGINLLNVNPGLAIWTAATFLVVLLVLWLFAWKPIISALDARNESVVNDLEKSKELREKAEKLLHDYEEKLESAKSEAHSIIDEGKRDAEVLSNKIKEEAKAESEKIKARIESDIEQAKLKALKELEDKVVDVTVQVLSKVMRIDINDSEHRDMISRELDALKQKAS